MHSTTQNIQSAGEASGPILQIAGDTSPAHLAFTLTAAVQAGHFVRVRADRLRTLLGMAATAAEIDGEPIPLLEAFSPAIFRDDWRQHYLAGRIFASFRAPCRLVPGTNVTIAGRTISFDAPVELPPIGADGYVAEACPFAGLI